MARPKKLVDVPTYSPTRTVRVPAEVFANPAIALAAAGGSVFVNVPCAPVPPLTPTQQTEIARAAGKKLTAEDWSGIEGARQHYVRLRRNELSGVEYSALKKKVQKIQAAANELKFLFDGPQDAALTIAWARLSKSEAPPFGYDEVYPALSMLVRRCHLASVQIEQESANGGWLYQVSPWDILIDALAGLYEHRGWSARASRPKGANLAPSLSSFCLFVRALMTSFPSDILEHHSADTVIANAVVEALSRRGGGK